MSNSYDEHGNPDDDDDELTPNQQQQEYDLIAARMENDTFYEELLDDAPPNTFIDTHPEK